MQMATVDVAARRDHPRWRSDRSTPESIGLWRCRRRETRRPGVSELRIDHGAGYRVYFQNRGSAIVVLLCGGDKSMQSKDIVTAKRVA
jgi:hypothetical protein